MGNKKIEDLRKNAVTTVNSTYNKWATEKVYADRSWIEASIDPSSLVPCWEHTIRFIPTLKEGIYALSISDIPTGN